MFRLSFFCLLYSGLLALSCTSGTTLTSFEQKLVYYSKGDSIIYRNAAEEFLTFIRSDIKDSTILLGSKPIPDLGFCLAHVLDDTITFTSKEIEKITEINANPIFSSWYDIPVPKAKVANRDTIVAIIRDDTRGWPYLYEKLGKGFYDLSMPIFIRDYNYCLFYINYECGPSCGDGQLNLYKKEGGRWKIVSTYCTSIS